MKHMNFRNLLTGLMLVCLASSASAAETVSKVVAEHRAIDPAVQVELIDTAGHVVVQGWEKAEVDVSGALGADADRLEITANGTHLTLRVVPKNATLHLGWWGGSESNQTHLVVKMPKGGSLQAHVTSTDLQISGIAGTQELQSVSGDINTNATSDARIRTVSGDIHLTAAATVRFVQLSTVSGDAIVDGAGTGEFSFQSVSGDAHLKSGVLNRVNLKSVSGDIDATVGMAADGRLEGETVSGNVSVHFVGGWPTADYEVTALSGDLSTCDAHKSTHDRYGPGSKLAFREGAATGRVHIDSKSGDIRLCGR
jgi:DUF4097 and DUF4098 domain-containing protein YvlB